MPQLLPLAPPNQVGLAVPMEQQQENVEEPENIPNDLINEIINEADLDVTEATIYFKQGYDASMYEIQEEEDKEINIDYLLL